MPLIHYQLFTGHTQRSIALCSLGLQASHGLRWTGLKRRRMQMNQIVAVDVTRFALDLHRDLSVTSRATKPGPPERIDGVTIGFVSVTANALHKGEVHPDGDEILYVISGRLRVIGESDPSVALDLGPGDACIVRKGEWHTVVMVEPAQLLHITPGPRGDYRPL
jgi:mannose-6-phosphate isomerase-like protein (cupin superfamily)